MRPGGLARITCGLLLLAALLVTAYPVSGQAMPDALLSYALTFTPAPASSPRTGAVVGHFGGVQVSGTYQGTSAMGILTLSVGAALFASGRYFCSYGCIFAGTIAGKPIMGLSALALQSTVNGKGSATSPAFPTFRIWVAAVRDWASTNLSVEEMKGVVSAVIKEGEDFQTLNDPSNNHGQNQATGGTSGGGTGTSAGGTGSGTSSGGASTGSGGTGTSGGGTGSGTSSGAGSGTSGGAASGTNGGMGSGTSGGGMGGGTGHGTMGGGMKH